MYLETAQPIRVSLLTDGFSGEWINPRKPKEIIKVQTVGRSAALQAPDEQDWLLHLRSTGGAGLAEGRAWSCD
jgi:hypothetical protein